MNEIIDESHWNLVYDNRIENRDNPLLSVDLSQEFYHHTIRITAKAEKVPVNWIRAGWLYHRLTTDLTTPFIVEVKEINLDVKQLIKLQPLTDRFYLSFKPMFRFLWMNIKIEYYDLEQ